MFILRHSVCFDGVEIKEGGEVLTKTLTALFTASASQQLLSKTAGHIGISFINTEGEKERGCVREGGKARGDGG